MAIRQWAGHRFGPDKTGMRSCGRVVGATSCSGESGLMKCVIRRPSARPSFYGYSGGEMVATWDPLPTSETVG